MEQADIGPRGGQRCVMELDIAKIGSSCRRVRTKKL
jgi:hypothetical protein